MTPRALFPCLLLTAAAGLAAAQSATRSDFARNLRWANEGQTPAQRTVGQDFAAGSVVRRNDISARLWFSKASDAGDQEARARLGWLLITGRGGAQDTARGLDLLQQAAARNIPVADDFLGMLAESGNLLPKNQALALDWYKKAVAAGDARGMALLGNAYLRGDGTPKSSRAGLALLQQSAALGDPWGQVSLADALLSGKTGHPDATQALALYRAAAAQNNPEAQYKLGILYQEGHVVAQNYELAGAFFERAAVQDFAPAESALAAFYDLGLGTAPDKVKAYVWATLASRQHEKVAQQRAASLVQDLTGPELAGAEARVHTFLATSSGTVTAPERLR